MTADDERVRRCGPSAARVVLMVLAACPRPADPRDPGHPRVCVTEGCVMSAASVLANMDKTVRPCDDFYEFACGKFTRGARVDDDKTKRTTFNAVNDMIADKVRRMLDETASAEPGPGRSGTRPRHRALARRLYGMCMDERRLDKLGTAPLLRLVAALGGWPVLDDGRWNGTGTRWTDRVYRFRELGLNVDYLLDLSVTVNHKDTTEHVVELDRPTLGLNPMYLKRGLGDKMVDSYYRYMVDVAVALGAQRPRAVRELRQSLDFEVLLARMSQMRSADGLADFTVLTMSELTARRPGVPWREYINRLVCPVGGGGAACVQDGQRVMVNVPGYLSGLDAVLRATGHRVQANYMVWRAVASCVSLTGGRLRDRQQAAQAEQLGPPVREPRWSECVEFVSSKLYLAVGAMYLKRHPDERVKTAVIDIINNVREEVYVALKNSDWMDPETKKNALDKAEAIDEFVAYPDELLDADKVDRYYAPLQFDDDGDYFGSVLRLAKFVCDKSFEKLHVPVNKSDWVTHGRVTVVNALYNLVENSIQIPAGILQGMFYSGDRPDYMNYGGAGYVIGHEMTHAFDNQGRLYDKSGNLRDWWRPETSGRFADRARCMVRQYGGFYAAAGVRVNGLNTLGENIADNGGVALAYNAYRRRAAAGSRGPEPRLPGLHEYTGRQMFWINAANVWCSVYRPETLRHTALTGRHALGRYRVIGAFQNQRHFAADFRCPVGSYMNPAVKCNVW